MLNFPEHKCGLYLKHNAHKDYYETVQDFVDKEIENSLHNFESQEDQDLCIKNNDI